LAVRVDALSRSLSYRRSILKTLVKIKRDTVSGTSIVPDSSTFPKVRVRKVQPLGEAFVLDGKQSIRTAFTRMNVFIEAVLTLISIRLLGKIS
jgi:hypothetical protein